MSKAEMNAATQEELELLETTLPVDEAEDAEESLLVIFAKPYQFEGQVFERIDLSAMEDITANDIITVNKMMNKKGGECALPEMSLNFACFMAARVTKKPVEFFTRLPARESMKLKAVVTGFLYGAE